MIEIWRQTKKGERGELNWVISEPADTEQELTKPKKDLPSFDKAGARRGNSGVPKALLAFLGGL